MPFRSPKMYSFIFGFQRFVWCPKCTPAASRSLIAIPGKLPPFLLAFTELETFPCAGHAVFLAFLDAGIRREQAVLLQLTAQFGVELHERARDTQAHGARLPVDTT